MKTTPSVTYFSLALRAGLDSLRLNLLVGSLIWSFAAILVVAYYQVPVVTTTLQKLVEFRHRTGLIYAMISSGLFAGLLPLLVSSLGKTSNRYAIGQVTLLTLFWALKGIELEYFYQLQGFVFGTDQEVSTILFKLLVDQFIYCPLWAIPTIGIMLFWVGSQYNLKTLLAEIAIPSAYQKHLLPLLLTSWAVSIPSVALIYSLPTALQLPLANLTQCFSAILFVTLNQRKIS